MCCIVNKYKLIGITIMKKNVLKIVILTASIIFAGYIIATEISEKSADKNLIKCFPAKSLTPECVLRVAGCNIIKTNSNIKINSTTNKVKHIKVRRGKRRRIFIDLDNDGIADDRNL